MNWFVFAILSPLFWGIENYVGKLVAMRGMDSKKVTTVFSGTVCLLSLLAMLLAKEPVLDWRFLFIVTTFTAVTFFFSMILRLNVLALVDASILYPFHKIVSLAALVGISFFLLRENLTATQLIGLLVVIPATFFLYDAPSLKKNIPVKILAIATASAFLAALSNYSADAATQTIKVFTFGFFTYFAGFLFSSVLSLMQKKKGKKRGTGFTKNLIVYSVVMGLFNFAGFCFFFLALSGGSLALVGGLNNLSLVVTVLLSLLLLKEPLTRNRLVGMGLSLISLYLLQ